MKPTILLPLMVMMCAPVYGAESSAPGGSGTSSSPAEKLGAAVEKDPGLPPVVSYTLKNGLRLLILEKKFVPTVSFTMIFKVGNVDGAPGKTGLAHLFEHMAFKGTKTINSANYEKEKPLLEKVELAAEALIAEESKQTPEPAKLETLRKKLSEAEKEADSLTVKDEYWKLYNELGESGMNAMTSTDYTGYVVSLPSNRLEAWMIIESDRFKNAVLREFYRERSVVMEERRMGESDPNRLLWETLFTNAFAAHPYHNPTIGWMDDLKRLTRTDADRFFKTFYAPNNATLSVVGDVKPEEVIKLAEKYFSSWEKRPLPETNYTKEPPQKSEKIVTVFFNAKPALRMGFHNPGFEDPDIYGLLMLSEILSGGKTSRFYRNLVEGRQLALYANSGHSTPGDRYPSLFVILAAPKEPHTVEKLETGLMEEIDKLKKEPPTQWEMEKVVNNYEAGLVRQLESNPGLGMSLASNQQILGDWKFDWKVAEKLRKLKPEDISRVAAKYFTRDNKTVVFLREPENDGAGPSSTEK
ncbi:MAG: pitrilysin family protein [Elusimicrobiales bacterium]